MKYPVQYLGIPTAFLLGGLCSYLFYTEPPIPKIDAADPSDKAVLPSPHESFSQDPLPDNNSIVSSHQSQVA